MNNVTEILNAPWAILPDTLKEIQEIYKAHVLGARIDIAAVEAKLGRPLKNEQESYTVHDGVAVLPINGVMGKRMNLMTQISGGSSTQLISKYFAEAMADEDVHSIVLHIDSPGGTVDGTETLANQIHAARGGKKPIIAVADGLMASAAYWVGSAAEKVYATERASQIGSIGVVASHVDYSKAEEKAGVKVTEIYAGKYKRIASEHAPLTKEGRETLQDKVDSIYSIFVDDVARNRGVTAEYAVEHMANGKLFAASKAVKVGLVDGVSTLSQVVADLNANPSSDFKFAAQSLLQERLGAYARH
jgi:signal peptide peptidase SppA